MAAEVDVVDLILEVAAANRTDVCEQLFLELPDGYVLLEAGELHRVV